MITAENLRKEFRVKRGGPVVEAVKGVSFNVPRGAIFGFLGPNGAGKTTTINILCTLLKPTSGKAALNGYDVVSQPHMVRQSIGLVFQDPSLDERLTAWENLEFHGMIYGMPRSLRRTQIGKLLSMVELDKRKNDLVNTFSGGMKRRLEIARGLLHNPKVLFLDEPTLGLDPQTRSHIWGYLHKLREENNITIFLTTHYMDEAENCDSIAIIDNGEMIALGTPDSLKKGVGGDIIYLQAADNKMAAEFVNRMYGYNVSNGGNGISFEVEKGEEFLPSFIKSTDFEIYSVGVRRPTLEDVFLKLTGHAIREESVDAMDSIKAHVRMRRRG
ncbi:MAG: ATP-binding cassette domain-containing protein [Nitrospirae bacterium]|nr:ATP-binding cassette domain-containing protein [Nitrospirota bacterium]